MKNTLQLLLCLLLVNGCIFHSYAQIITTIAGNGSVAYSGDGNLATLASFISPTSLALDRYGNVYVNDEGSGILITVVRKIDHTSGIISTIAGQSAIGFSGDGGAATAAKLQNSWGISMDGGGNLFIADQNNFRIRRVEASGIINTVAGNGRSIDSNIGGLALAAAIGIPVGIVADAPGNFYFCDQPHFLILKVNTGGIIDTFAGCGSGNYWGDGGPAKLAAINTTYGLALDHLGNLYICDADNNRIRKVTPAGIISTVAGSGSAGYYGDGLQATNAQLNHPAGICADEAGNLYIADTYNNRIRKVNTSGIISTIAGTGVAGFSGDTGMATNAKLDNPISIVIDSFDNLYFTDFNNKRIRKIFKDLIFNLGHRKVITACQNVSTPVDSVLSIQDLGTGMTDTWSLSSPAVNGSASVYYTTTSTGGQLTPSGLFYTPNPGYTGNDSFKVKVTNGLDSNFISIYVNVIPILSYGGVINGNSNVCVGDTIMLSDTTGNGAWSIANLNATVNGGIVSGEVPGPDTVKYTISNMCGSITAVKPIIIRGLPDAGHITGVSAICIGATSAYTDNIPGGIWGIRNPDATISASGTVTGAKAGIDTVLYMVSDAFCKAYASLKIKIDSFPYGFLYPADTAVCVGATITLADTPAGGTWLMTNSDASVSNGIVTTLQTGMDTVNYLVTNACGTATIPAYIRINPLPVTPVIMENGSVLSVPSVYSAYQWQKDGTAIPGSAFDTLLVSVTGSYSVYVRNEFGCSVISQQVVVNGCTPADIVVYPNPTQSTVYINWCKAVKARVICADGKIFDITGNTNKIDLTYLPNADYLLVLYDSDGHKVKTTKITKLTQ